jgi:hypothetical protein
MGLRFLVIATAPDASPANKRMLAELAAHLGPRMLFWRGSCAVHMMHNIISKAINEPKLCGDIFACQHTCSVPNNYGSMLAAFRRWVVDKLIYHNDQSLPDPAWETHQQALLDNTLRRRTSRIVEGNTK